MKNIHYLASFLCLSFALSHCYFGPERSLFAAPEGKEKDKHKKEAR